MTYLLDTNTCIQYLNGNIGNLPVVSVNGSFAEIVAFNDIELQTASAGVPEPSTLTLAALGFLVLLKRRRRRA